MRAADTVCVGQLEDALRARIDRTVQRVPEPGHLAAGSMDLAGDLRRVCAAPRASPRAARAHSSAAPRITGPAPRMPAATAPCSDSGSAASVIRAAMLLGISPCSAIETSSRSRKKRSSSLGSRPVSSRWKYSVKLSRPIRSPVRSRPRTSIRSGEARLMRVTGSPALPICMCRYLCASARPRQARTDESRIPRSRSRGGTKGESPVSPCVFEAASRRDAASVA